MPMLCPEPTDTSVSQRQHSQGQQRTPRPQLSRSCPGSMLRTSDGGSTDLQCSQQHSSPAQGGPSTDPKMLQDTVTIDCSNTGQGISGAKRMGSSRTQKNVQACWRLYRSTCPGGHTCPQSLRQQSQHERKGRCRLKNLDYRPL